MSSTSRRRFVQGTSAAAASTFFIGRARAQEPEFIMKIATVAPPGTPWAKQLKDEKKRIKEASGGRIKVKTYLGGALGEEVATAEATKRGTIQCFGGTAGALSSLVPEMAVLELPYLFPNVAAADRIIDEVIREDLANLLAARGFVLSFFTENGYRSIGSTFPVATPDDLVGRKMRSQDADVHLETWRKLGASPVPITVGEVTTSLQTGVVEGFDNTPLFTFAASWYQSITHFTLTQHIYQAGVVVYSKPFFDSLPSDLQTVLAGDPAKAAKKGRRGVRDMDDLLLQNFVDAGIALNKLSDIERTAFASKAVAVHGSWRDSASAEGKALYDKIKAAL